MLPFYGSWLWLSRFVTSSSPQDSNFPYSNLKAADARLLCFSLLVVKRVVEASQLDSGYDGLSPAAVWRCP